MTNRINTSPACLTVGDTLTFRDRDFATIQIPCAGSLGTRYFRKVPVGMPQIPPYALDLVCYLYQNKNDAMNGCQFGGTAFLVAIRSRVPGYAYQYAVTNWHVACHGGASCLRVNTNDGQSEVFDFGPEDWEFDPRFDIAVCPVQLDPQTHKSKMVGKGAFVMPSSIEREKLGPGEDVFMVGRFVDHDGGAVNRPAVRFGNISVMPTPIKQPNGRFADAYCIDIHSRTGYSGSPVFVYRTPGSDLSAVGAKDIKDSSVLLSGVNYLGLLGIHFAQFPEEWEIQPIGSKKEIPTHSESGVPLISDGAYVKGLSGMSCVLPAWHIAEVLDMPKLKGQRDRSEELLEERLRSEGKAVPLPEIAVSPASDENPTHREDFTSLLGKAARTPPQDD